MGKKPTVNDLALRIAALEDEMDEVHAVNAERGCSGCDTEHAAGVAEAIDDALTAGVLQAIHTLTSVAHTASTAYAVQASAALLGAGVQR